MNFNFTGSISERHINLGSANEKSSSQVAQQARDQRAVRLEIRQRHAAATKIQSVVRGRTIGGNIRSQYYNTLLGTTHPEVIDFITLTRLTAFVVKRPLLQQKYKLTTNIRLSKAESDALDDDDRVLQAWASRAMEKKQILVQGRDVEVPVFIKYLSESADGGFCASLQYILQTVIFHFLLQSGPAQAQYDIFFSVIENLITKQHIVIRKPLPYTDSDLTPTEAWTLWSIDCALFQALRQHIMSLPAKSKATLPTLEMAMDLICVTLRQSTPLPIGKFHPTLSRAKILQSFTRDILSTPNLPLRIPRTSLTELAVVLPLVEVAEVIVSSTDDFVDSLDSLNLLANFVALGWKRISYFKDGASLRIYLLSITKLQNNSDQGVLRAPSSKDHITESNLLEDLDDAQDHSSLDKVLPHVDSATLQRLQIIPSQEHLSTILAVSARFPNTTREALCSFLVSLLHSWDPQMQDRILACVTYRYSAPGIQSHAGASHSVGGLVRELWRGYVRGSKLSRSLSITALQGRKSLLSVLSDENLSTLWPCLVILCQLYSRSLLTIGDDEFYPSETMGTPSSTSTRNPLSLDEVVSLSGLLRNLGFALYWYEGTGGALNELQKNHVVGTKKLDLLSLRNVVTRLLQQLHQRDSRRKFAPENHWLMNSEMDLSSFIQSVVLEEDELNQHQDEARNDLMDIDNDSHDQQASATPPERTSISSRLASHRIRGKRGLSARSLAYLSPRLGVLNNIPFVIPFEVRVEIFHQFTALDYARLKRQKSFHGPLREVTIRRTNVAEDGFKQLNGLGENLKHKFSIKFVDQFGIEESGIDGGGLFKEFLTSLIKEAFDTDRGLWSATSDQQLYPNPHSYAKSEENQQWYRFLGRVLGKALYEGILVDINFASFFLSKWLGRGHGYLDDLSGLESLDKDVYRNLLWLKHYSGDVEKDLALDFTVVDEEFGIKHVRELIPNGKNISVTRENRLEYIYRVSHYRLNEQIRQQSEAFLSGLTELIDLRWLRMLNREELRILISGTEGDIDLEDLRSNTVLGGYHERDEVLDFFWASLASFTRSERKAFLKFVTSCPSPPLLGFGQLNPKFGIRSAGDDTCRLPTASTCVNLLKLPRYTSFEQCREKLLYSIHSGAGFDLS